MGTGNESKVRPGQPLKITAELWNDMIDVVRDWKRSKSVQNPGAFTSAVNQALTCLVSNETGIDFVYPFQVVRLEDMNFQPNARTKYAFGKRSVVDAHIPDGPSNHIAVVQGPLQGGGNTWGSTTSMIGMAVIRGLTLVRLRLVNAGHQFAVPVAGETGFMESAESGVARIIEYMVEPVQSGEEPIGSEGSGDFYLALIDLVNGGAIGEPEQSEPGDVAGTGNCKFAKLRPTDGVIVKDILGNANLAWGSPGAWFGTNARGTWEFDYDGTAGLPYLKLDGKKLIPCGDGCYTGGAFTGHEIGSIGDSGPICEGEAFTVCVECGCAAFAGYDGPGFYCLEVDDVCVPIEIIGDGDECEPWVYCSGPYETEEEARQVCGLATSVSMCGASPPISTLLLATVTAATGAFSAALGRSFYMTYRGLTTPASFPAWWGHTDFGSCCGPVMLMCTGGGWQYRTNVNGGTLAQIKQFQATGSNCVGPLMSNSGATGSGMVFVNSPRKWTITLQYGSGPGTNDANFCTARDDTTKPGSATIEIVEA